MTGVLAVTRIATTSPIEIKERQSSDFKRELISSHNFFRAQHGAKQLRWNDDLAKKAQNWANTCKWSHDSPGENLASSTGFTSWGNFVNMWGTERQKYNWNSPGFSVDTGHFTQVVWKKTRGFGCGWQKCNGGQHKANGFYIVCKYDPYGNYAGQFPLNVGKQTQGKPNDIWRK